MARAGLIRRRPGLWLIALLLLALLAGALWWKLAHWAPDRAEFPVQGAWLTGEEDLEAIAALPNEGASFAYVTASTGARRSTGFSAAYEAAREAGLQAGPVHIYDPCTIADAQSSSFVTVVPRDADMLAPAVLLGGSGESCDPRVRPAELESELVVFLNQIESHAGKRAILAPTAKFENEYGFGAKAARRLWLTRGWLEPDYAGRPWELWTANAARRVGDLDRSVAWIVSRP